jgi:hypothetical protein
MTSNNRLVVAIVALLLLASAHAANTFFFQESQEQPSPWQSPCADLARQIAALTGPGTINLKIESRSTLTSDDITVIRRLLERELRSAGVVSRAKSADSEVRVTLSQNENGLLWVAEVQEGSETKVAMLPIPGATARSAGPAEAVTMNVHAELIHSEVETILDLAVFGTGADAHLVILQPQHIKTYLQTGGTWQLTQSYDIASAHPFPRDVRGRMVPAADHLFDAYLPGLTCAATKPPDNWTLMYGCRESDDPWPLGSQKAFYNAARNFFTGVLTPGFGPKLPPFYSAAELVRAGGTTFLVADVNGAVHLLEGGSHKLLIGARDWGSDIVAVRSECGSGTQVLASAAGWPVQDSVRAYEVTGREARPVSAPSTFNGIVTAIWPTADGTSAIVIVRKAQESGYEAYRVSVHCNH